MFPFLRLVAALVAFSAICVLGQDQQDFNIKNLPYQWEAGQFGTNQCKQWQPSHPWSNCQNLFINHGRDFCLWAPHNPATIGESERTVVSWCVKAGYGTRLIPDGTLTGAHFIKTPDFLQVTGYGNFNNMNIPWDDDGGELDRHGADGLGNPLGGLVWSRNVMGREGEWVQIKEWSNFMSKDEFSLRACYGPKAAQYCPHTLDEMGSRFNHPGNYDIGYFDDCMSASGPFPNVFNGKEFHQGDPYTPEAHKPAPRWGCSKPRANIRMGIGAKVTPYRRAYDLEQEEEDENIV